MKRCENCLKSMEYKQVLNSVICSYKDIECKNCKSIHYVSFSTRLITSAAIALPILLFPYLANRIGYYTIILYIIWVIFSFSIIPYIASYKVKK